MSLYECLTNNISTQNSEGNTMSLRSVFGNVCVVLKGSTERCLKREQALPVSHNISCIGWPVLVELPSNGSRVRVSVLLSDK